MTIKNKKIDYQCGEKMTELKGYKKINVYQKEGDYCVPAAIQWMLEWVRQEKKLDIGLTKEELAGLQEEIFNQKKLSFKPIKEYLEEKYVNFPKDFLQVQAYKKEEGNLRFEQIKKLLGNNEPCAISLPEGIGVRAKREVLVFSQYVSHKEKNDNLFEKIQNIYKRGEIAKNIGLRDWQEKKSRLGPEWDLIVYCHISPVVECSDDSFTVKDLRGNETYHSYPKQFLIDWHEKIASNYANDIAWFKLSEK